MEPSGAFVSTSRPLDVMPENPFLALTALSAAVLLWAPVEPAAPGPARGAPTPAVLAASVRLADGETWVVRPAAGQRLAPLERAAPDRRPASLASSRRPTVLASLPVVVAAPALAPAEPPTPVPAPVPLPPRPVATADAPPPAPAPAELAPADEPVPAPPEWLQRRADEALALISYPWQVFGYEIHFHSGRAGTRAQTLRIERRIEVFARPTDSARRTAYDLAHEIAHVFDFTRGTETVHARWLEARGLQGREWYGCNACSDLATPAGDFAESFAYWLVPGGDFGSRLGPPPSDEQRALLAELTAFRAD